MNIKDQQPNIRHFRGFTLIELIIVIIILTILAAGSTRLLTHGFNAYIAAQNIMNPQQQARVALEVMTRDLRTIRSPTYINSSFTANNLAFTDVDNTNIYYQFSNNQLQRKIGASGSYQTLANNVQSITISYYDATGAQVLATQNMLIRYITVTITVNVSNIPFTLNTGVYPWNLN